MIPPRATLRMIAPGRIRAISAAPMSPRVARVSGTWTVRTSTCSSSSSQVDELDAVVGSLLGA